MKYLFVIDQEWTRAYTHRFWLLVEQCGILKEDCDVISFLGDDIGRGSGGKILQAQLKDAVPAFRSALCETEAECVITMGAASFRAFTGLEWDTTKIAGYVLEPADLGKVTIKEAVHIGEYKSKGKSKAWGAHEKGDAKYKMMDVAKDPILPSGCKWILPGIPVEHVVKASYKNITVFRAAFKNAVRLMNGERPIDDRFHWTEGLPPIAFDTTNNPIQTMKAQYGGDMAYDLEVPIGSTAIEQASICANDHTWTFPWSADAVLAFKQAMSFSDTRIAHNQKYDIPKLKHHGIDVPREHFDTMIAAVLLEPDVLKGLEAVAPLYLLVKPWKSLGLDYTNPFYNAKDSFVTYELAKVMREKLKDRGMWELFRDRIMPSIPVLEDMETRGVKVDPLAAFHWCEALRDELLMANEEWKVKYPALNVSSYKDIKRLLYSVWGHAIIRRRGDGIRIDEFAIRRIMKDMPHHKDDCELILKIRHLKKDLKTYGQEGKDRVHPAYLPASRDTEDSQGNAKGLAATGRLACRGTNFQNQPKSARKMFIPDNPDMCFLEFDWSQAELRVPAALSGDLELQKALEGDLHAVTQARMGCNERVEAKTTIFLAAYGGGAKGLGERLEAQGIKASWKKCQQFLTDLASAYPKWWAWRQTIMDLAETQQYLRNPFGRVRRFPMGKADERSALNFMPQSIVADMSWPCYLQVHNLAKTFGGRLTGVVHDSFLVQLPIEGVNDKVIQAFLNILEQPFDEVVPGFVCPATVSIGEPGASWADLVEREM